MRGPGAPSGYTIGMTSKIGPKGQVVIPKPIRDRLGMRPGDRVSVEERGGAVEVTKAESGPAQVVVRPCASIEVAACLTDGETLFEELDGALVLALAHEQVPEVVQRDREQPLFTSAAADLQRLLEQRTSLVVVTPPARDDREQVDRHRVHMLLLHRGPRDLEDA